MTLAAFALGAVAALWLIDDYLIDRDARDT